MRSFIHEKLRSLYEEEDSLCPDKSSLYKSIANERWQDSRILLESPNFTPLVNYGTDCDSTLHIACVKNAPLDIVERIVRLNPVLTIQQSYFGWNPLHYACAHASEKVIRLLVSMEPDAARARNSRGCLPLHVAITHKRSPSIVWNLIRAHPRDVHNNPRFAKNPLQLFFLQWSDHFNNFPPNIITNRFLPQVHTLDGTKDPVLLFKETLRQLLKVHHHSTEKHSENTDFALLLHQVMMCTNITVPTELLLLLVHSSRNECVQHDNRNNFVLHLTCSYTPRYI